MKNKIIMGFIVFAILMIPVFIWQINQSTLENNFIIKECGLGYSIKKSNFWFEDFYVSQIRWWELDAYPEIKECVIQAETKWREK